MLSVTPATRVFLALAPVDMRKSFNGLYTLAKEQLQQEPTSGHLFVFTNRLRNRLKILFWDGYENTRIMGRLLPKPCDFGAIRRGLGPPWSHNSRFSVGVFPANSSEGTSMASVLKRLGIDTDRPWE